MTESVRAPDPPLVDPETGETAPLSPRFAYRPPRYDDVFADGLAWLDALADTDEWSDYERDISAHLEPDDAA